MGETFEPKESEGEYSRRCKKVEEIEIDPVKLNLVSDKREDREISEDSEGAECLPYAK